LVKSLLPPEIETVHYSEIQRVFPPEYFVLTSGDLTFRQLSTDYNFISERGEWGGGIRKNGEDRSVLSYSSQLGLGS